MFFKRILLALLIGFSTTAAAHAQGTPQTEAMDKSLNFVINGIGTFGVTGPLVGTVPLGNTGLDSIFNELAQLLGQRLARPIFGVGATFFVADNIAVRLGLGFNATTNTRTIVDPTDPDKTIDVSDTRTAFAIAPALQVHIANEGPVSVYTGAAISFASASTSDDDETATTGSQTGLGFGVLIGGQFFPWDNISLGVESQFGAVINSTSTTSPDGSGDRVTADGPSTLDIGFTLPFAVNLGIHF